MSTMSPNIISQRSSRCGECLLLAVALVSSCSIFVSTAWSANERFGPELHADDFRSGSSNWHDELEKPGSVVIKNGVLDINVPAGATLWYRHELKGRVAITYKATAVSNGGQNDRVSDLNCFWMARNRDGSSPLLGKPRTGRFADYNDLLTYYVGLGGNTNTTTRFRRYIGDPVQRPLLPEHDLSDPSKLLAPNREQTIKIIVDGPHIEYWRDDDKVFDFHDQAPYAAGWFALRTTQSHLRIRDFKVYRLPDPSQSRGSRTTKDQSKSAGKDRSR